MYVVKSRGVINDRTGFTRTVQDTELLPLTQPHSLGGKLVSISTDKGIPGLLGSRVHYNRAGRRAFSGLQS